ncbi:Lrp/AsnC family transcriptional regulator [Leucobacter allii]|uniref:Lrp/AsnC family transcriptional regulator n=1 Tax=Leucobacter allii TaxID=2932247 RepID=A0ABY4FIC8_9MICO|nr:Lrp/AsnC family transcriptional regulator [Leucobacter allii]UOQ56419.1 Lrp/AsnC family transcriptional regulator [Leucobacter allii]
MNVGGMFHGLKPAELDELDRKLILLLQQDGRMSVAEMSRAVGLSHPAVRQRLQRLFESKIANITATTHPGTHGLTESALIVVRTDERMHQVAAQLAEFPEVYYLVTTQGRFDIALEAMARDKLHLSEISLRIRATPGVVSSETISITETVKWEYGPDFTALD